ncbi:flagellar hook-basal body complex protein FliE [Massilia sp. PDC64]|nr:flagellar hook-basal body complex protein FliE [Massilia sp. PDC64]SDF64249.1 flagellar hook-basal body complex protein FliE [Massilia sp. PDC64]
MSVDPVSLSAILPAAEKLPSLAPAQQAAPGFATWLTDGINAVNGTLVKADSEVRQVALGTGPSLHDVMIHLEEARLSFQLLAQVRNRLLDAYQEVMRMQV